MVSHCKIDESGHHTKLHISWLNSLLSGYHLSLWISQTSCDCFLSLNKNLFSKSPPILQLIFWHLSVGHICQGLELFSSFLNSYLKIWISLCRPLLQLFLFLLSSLLSSSILSLPLLSVIIFPSLIDNRNMEHAYISLTFLTFKTNQNILYQKMYNQFLILQLQNKKIIGPTKRTN